MCKYEFTVKPPHGGPFTVNLSYESGQIAYCTLLRLEELERNQIATGLIDADAIAAEVEPANNPEPDRRAAVLQLLRDELQKMGLRLEMDERDSVYIRFESCKDFPNDLEGAIEAFMRPDSEDCKIVSEFIESFIDKAFDDGPIEPEYPEGSGQNGELIDTEETLNI
jgi:hypothetical protein